MWEDKNSDEENQKGQALKILTLDEMLSRLPITLAQIKTGNNSENLKSEIRQLLYFLNLQKNLLKQYIIVSSIPFKNGNSLYEHWK